MGDLRCSDSCEENTLKSEIQIRILVDNDRYTSVPLVCLAGKGR
jgi:hypothetical protein